MSNEPCPSCDRDLSYPGHLGHQCYTYAQQAENQRANPFKPEGWEPSAGSARVAHSDLNCPVCGSGEEGDCLCDQAEAIARAKWVASGKDLTEGPWETVLAPIKSRLIIKALADIPAPAPSVEEPCPDCGGDGMHAEGCRRVGSKVQFGPPWLPFPAPAPSGEAAT